MRKICWLPKDLTQRIWMYKIEAYATVKVCRICRVILSFRDALGDEIYVCGAVLKPDAPRLCSTCDAWRLALSRQSKDALGIALLAGFAVYLLVLWSEFQSLSGLRM
jgi:hypothetical protein